MRDLLTPRQAADYLGVSESTVRRWCDRALLPMTRTSGKHRRIARGDLIAFARRQGLLAPDEGDVASAAGRGGRLASTIELSNRLFAAMVALDDRSIRSLLIKAMQGAMAPAVLCDQVIAPAMHRLGDAWIHGSVQVFQEHAASEAIRDSLAHTRALLPDPAADAPVAITAALSDDPYSLAPAMAAFVLQAEGYRAVLLGVDTPAVELGRAVRDHDGRLLAISVGGFQDATKLAEDLNLAIAGALDCGARVAVGGLGLDSKLRSKICPDFFGDTMSHLASFAARTLPGASAAAR